MSERLTDSADVDPTRVEQNRIEQHPPDRDARKSRVAERLGPLAVDRTAREEQRKRVAQRIGPMAVRGTEADRTPPERQAPPADRSQDRRDAARKRPERG